MTNDECGNGPIGHSSLVIDSSFWFRHSSFLVLIAILVVAGALRFHRAGQTSLSFDEIWHLAISTGNGSPHMVLPTDALIENAPSPTSLDNSQPFWKVWGNIQRALHPPLYFVALHCWREVFGASDLTAQSLSIVCSLVMLILLFDVARLRFGERISLLSCAILAVAPIEIFLHQQTRGYAMLQMLGMGMLSALTRIEILGFNTRRATALLLMALAMMLTHYFAVAAVGAMGLYGLLMLSKQSSLSHVLVGEGACENEAHPNSQKNPHPSPLPEYRARGRVAVVLVIAAALYALFWGPFIPAQLRDVATTADTFLKENRSDHFLATILRLLQLPAQHLFDLPTQLPAVYAILIGAGFIPCVLAWRDCRSRALIFFLVGTFGFVALLDLTRSTTHLLYMRYTMLGLPVFVVLTLAGLKRIAPIAAVALIATGLFVSVTGKAIREEPDWWFLREYVQKEVHEGDVILFAPGRRPAWANQMLYLGIAHYSQVFPQPMVLMTRPTDVSLREQLKGRTCFLIVFGPASAEEWAPGMTVVSSDEFPPVAQVFKLKG
jgi:hypothetical protein